MHNWRLLLLALVAVLQPIASFTDRNLIDGRQGCFDRQPHSLLRDTRLHGTSRFSKITPEERRLGRREEILEGRRYEARRQKSVLTRPLTERSLLERSTRRISSQQAARSLRTEYRTARITDDHHGDVLLRTRERNFRDIQTIKRDDYDEGFSRDILVRQHDRNIKSTQNRMSRLDSRTAFLSTKRLSEQMANSGVVIRSRETKDLFPRRSLVDKAQSRMYIRRNKRDESRKRIVQRRETLFSLETRPQIENHRERQSLDRHTRKIVIDFRRAHSANARINEVRNVRQEMRRNTRQDPEDRRSPRQRLVTERLDERMQLRDLNRATRDRTMSVNRESRENRLTERRLETRDSASRIVEINLRSEIVARNIKTRINYGRNPKFYSEDRQVVRDDSRRIIERKFDINSNRVLERRTRVVNRINVRDTRIEAKFTGSTEEIYARDVPRTRKEHGNVRDGSVKHGIVDSRYRNTELTRNRENLDFMTRKKAMSEDQTFTMNWRFVFYTLQGIYLCNLLVQMLSENESTKKAKNLTRWASFSGNSIKVD